MSRASISFEDTEDGVLLTLNFDDELPEDPADASEAQVSAMIAFQQYLDQSGEDENHNVEV